MNRRVKLYVPRLLKVLYWTLIVLIVSTLLSACGMRYCKVNYRSEKETFLGYTVERAYSAALGILPYVTERPLVASKVTGISTDIWFYGAFPYDMTRKTLDAFHETGIFPKTMIVPEDPRSIVSGTMREKVKEIAKKYHLDLVFAGELTKVFDVVGKNPDKKEIVEVAVRYSIYDSEGNPLISETVSGRAARPDTKYIPACRHFILDTGTKGWNAPEDQCMEKIITSLAGSETLAKTERGKKQSASLLAKEIILPEGGSKKGTLIVDFSGNARAGFNMGTVKKVPWRHSLEMPITIFIDDAPYAEEMIKGMGPERVVEGYGSDYLIRDYEYTKEIQVEPGPHVLKVFLDEDYWRGQSYKQEARNAPSRGAFGKNFWERGVKQHDKYMITRIANTPDSYFIMPPGATLRATVTLDCEGATKDERYWGVHPHYEIVREGP